MIVLAGAHRAGQAHAAHCVAKHLRGHAEEGCPTGDVLEVLIVELSGLVRSPASATPHQPGDDHARIKQAASLPQLPFEDQSFDLVVCGHLLFCYAPRSAGGLMPEPGLDLTRLRQVRRHPYAVRLLAELPANWQGRFVSTTYDQGHDGCTDGLELDRRMTIAGCIVSSFGWSSSPLPLLLPQRGAHHCNRSERVGTFSAI